MTRILSFTAAAVALATLAACEPTGSSGPGSNIPTGPYVLVGIGSDTVPQRNVGLTIESDGSISGQAPCNHYSAPQVAEPPGFKLGPLTTTKMACGGKAGALEQRYFNALSQADGISYKGGVLVITGGPSYLTFEPGYRKE
ncbi:META domain-containing protein [Paracoccus sp. CPCC 101403]|uniref:META domain-containing protein n=2 Tax=Paracoccus broussonetiae TaxID=3075834 RepID=A0ABU3EBE0_9RHOB|nr:META domain-containing protein [Paracoccus sp. CPCC 101403]MDT1061532.1 META domain-containing protein [Paracoccus sp. CPCC 101403]